MLAGWECEASMRHLEMCSAGGCDAADDAFMALLWSTGAVSAAIAGSRVSRCSLRAILVEIFAARSRTLSGCLTCPTIR